MLNFDETDRNKLIYNHLQKLLDDHFPPEQTTNNKMKTSCIIATNMIKNDLKKAAPKKNKNLMYATRLLGSVFNPNANIDNNDEEEDMEEDINTDDTTRKVFERFPRKLNFKAYNYNQLTELIDGDGITGKINKAMESKIKDNPDWKKLKVSDQDKTKIMRIAQQKLLEKTRKSIEEKLERLISMDDKAAAEEPTLSSIQNLIIQKGQLEGMDKFNNAKLDMIRNLLSDNQDIESGHSNESTNENNNNVSCAELLQELRDMLNDDNANKDRFQRKFNTLVENAKINNLREYVTPDIDFCVESAINQCIEEKSTPNPNKTFNSSTAILTLKKPIATN